MLRNASKFRALVRSFGIAFLIVSSAASLGQPPRPGEFKNSVWSRKLTDFGWSPSRRLSNKEFLYQIGAGDYGSLDEIVRLAFISDDCVAAFYTKQVGDYKSKVYEMEILFIDAKKGTLLSTQRRPTTGRTTDDDSLDSLNRVIPLDGERFAVLTAGKLQTFDRELHPLEVLELDPPPTIWAVQAVDDGRQLELRHEIPKPYSVRFSWFATDSLRPLAGYKDVDFGILGGPTAGSDGVLFVPTKRGLRQIKKDSERLICDGPLCSEPVNYIGGGLLGFPGSDWIGVVSLERGVLWQRALPHMGYDQYGPDSLSSEMKSSRFGDRVALLLKSFVNHTLNFDGFKLDQSPTLFVFNSSTGEVIYTNSFKPRGDTYDFAISPNGKRIALYDGESLCVLALSK